MQFLFGPVPSRRLGFSVGIDIVPYKTCSYDCLYCELGKTTRHIKKRASFFSIERILNEIKEFLNSQKLEIDFLTLSGSGEPTLNLDLGEIIGFLKKVTNIPVAVLTNSSLLYLPDVRKDLSQADLVIPSLDAASESVFKKINQPGPGVKLATIIEGLKKFSREYQGRLWLEVLFCHGVNDSEEEVKKIARIAQEINCEKIQLGTVARPPAELATQPVTKEKLLEFCRFFGPKAEVIGTFEAKPQKMNDAENKIVSILERRPMSEADLANLLKIKRPVLVKMLDKLERLGQLVRVRFERKNFFQRR